MILKKGKKVRFLLKSGKIRVGYIMRKFGRKYAIDPVGSYRVLLVNPEDIR